MHRIWYFLILFFSIIFQQLLFVPLGMYLWAEPLLPIVVLIIITTATGSVLAEGLGFFTGIVWGFTKIDTGTPPGVYPLLLTIIAFLLGRFLYDRFKSPSTLLMVICTIVAVLFWGLGGMALKLIFVNTYIPNIVEFAYILLSMVYSSVLCLIINPLMRKFLHRWEWNGSI